MSLTETQRKTLMKVAQASIENGLYEGQPLTPDPMKYEPVLQEHRATFVTLEIANTLRGCIGTLVALRPLVSDVAYHAHAAAFSDPRFPPLRLEEFSQLEIHISILSLPESIHFESEQDLIQQLRPGVDGLILEEGWHKGTFLPAVWESLPEAREFLRQLKRKAGLNPEYWSEKLKVSRYTTESFGQAS